MSGKLMYKVITLVVTCLAFVMAFYFSKGMTFKVMSWVGVWATFVMAFEAVDILHEKMTDKKNKDEEPVVEETRNDIPRLVLIVGESMAKNRRDMDNMMRDLQYVGVPITYYHYQEHKLIFTTDKAQVRFMSVERPNSFRGMRADEVFGCLSDAEKLCMRTHFNVDKPLYDGDATDYLLELHGVVN